MRPNVISRFALFCVVSLACTTGLAQSTTNLQRSVEQFLTQQTQDLPGKPAIEIGKVSDSNRAAQCKTWQAFLPAGERAWGRVTVGVRCLEGTTLSLFVTANVKVEGKYVVMMRAVSGGQVLTASDVELTDGELTALPPDIVTQIGDVVGQTTRQGLSPKQPLRAVYLKSAIAVQAGQTVKVISRGPSFAVANVGKALNNAELGQLVRVRLDNKQIVSGIARETGVIEVVTE